MSLFKPSDGKQQGDKGLSLLQGLGILAIIGIVAAIVVNYFL